ncbi:MAG: hypothetical protein HOP12_06205 [Candidatus Eisenbacteria bacterium]|uniref:Tetratricopeptide repeat protein n=1 Tax=Eiseniibacteriota bacterium TaxID=2212470 RepID=A0A849SDF5_UNCEI|nr:hypothetical protein [Candidatus Eisenbacteria bacterium]
MLSHLSDRVGGDSGPGLDPVLGLSLRRVLVELERFIPGLDAPPDTEAARHFRRAAEAALADDLPRDTLARSLRGLSFAPHDPQLHYLAACACFELGAVREAVLLLSHALWIHPGHPDARRDFLSFSTAPAATNPDPADDIPASNLEGWEAITPSESLGFEFVDQEDGTSPELRDPERQKPVKKRATRKRRKPKPGDDSTRRAA